MLMITSGLQKIATKKNSAAVVAFTLVVAFAAVLVVTGADSAFAQGSASNNFPEPMIENPLKVNSIAELVDLLVSIALRIAQVVAVLAIIYSGFLFVKAQGSPDGIKEAKNVFYYTIIGIALLFGANVLVEIVRNTIQPLFK